MSSLARLVEGKQCHHNLPGGRTHLCLCKPNGKVAGGVREKLSSVKVWPPASAADTVRVGMDCAAGVLGAQPAGDRLRRGCHDYSAACCHLPAWPGHCGIRLRTMNTSRAYGYDGHFFFVIVPD